MQETRLTSISHRVSSLKHLVTSWSKTFFITKTLRAGLAQAKKCSEGSTWLLEEQTKENKITQNSSKVSVIRMHHRGDSMKLLNFGVSLFLCI